GCSGRLPESPVKAEARDILLGISLVSFRENFTNMAPAGAGGGLVEFAGWQAVGSKLNALPEPSGFPPITFRKQSNAGMLLASPFASVTRLPPVHCELFVAKLPAYVPPEHRPKLPPVTSGPMGGNGSDCQKAGFADKKNDAGRLLLLGTALANCARPLGTSPETNRFAAFTTS